MKSLSQDQTSSTLIGMPSEKIVMPTTLSRPSSGSEGGELIDMLRLMYSHSYRLLAAFAARFCPGRVFAESILWITMANVLAAFDILPCVDPISGKEVLPVPEFESEIVKCVTKTPLPLLINGC